MPLSFACFLAALVFVILSPADVSAQYSRLRFGGLVRQPSANGVSGDARLECAAGGAWRDSHVFPGGPVVFNASGDVVLSGSVRPAGTRVLCVVDGRAVLNATVEPSAEGGAWSCDLRFLSHGGQHVVAAYGAAGSGATLLGEVLRFFVSPPPEARAQAAQQEAPRLRLSASDAALRAQTPGGVLGIYYTTYQQVVSQLYQNVSRETGRPSNVTIDDVVASDGELQFGDAIWKYFPNASSPSWQHQLSLSQEPALGVYCYYRRRANESVAPLGIADCPEAAAVLAAHAALLSSAGFEYVAPDATNWDGDPRNASNGADLNQLRPTEVIAEEWANVRLGGAASPQLSTFDQVNDGGVLYNWYLSEFFNNETLLDLDMIFRKRNTSRVPGFDKIYIVADEGANVNYTLVAAIGANGGRNDISTPIMWGAPNASGAYEASGRLVYISTCTTTLSGGGPRQFTADAFLDLDTPCAHIKTTNSPVGDVWTVSTGIAFNSCPICATRWNGLFLKKQFADVFADPEPTDVLFAPSWNEFAASANPMARWDITNPLFNAAGAAEGDPDRQTIWLDGMTSERSRTVEPSRQDGGYYYETFASCMRVYRLQGALGIVSGGLSCDVAGEECCAVHADEVFATVFSLEAPGAADALLTADAAERARLLENGWREICAPMLNSNMPTTRVCANASLIWSGGPDLDVARGPLVLLSNASLGVPGTAPLVRCVDPASGRHFLDKSVACRGAGRAEVVLGFGGDARGGLFSREVRLCARAGAAPAAYYSVANALCADGDADEGVVGYAV